jgi:hypothetical protein
MGFALLITRHFSSVADRPITFTSSHLIIYQKEHVYVAIGVHLVEPILRLHLGLLIAAFLA